jgi:Domain of Unknown Function with PDB structure (DUF3858)
MIAEKCSFSKLDSMFISGDNSFNDPITINYNFSTEMFANRIQEDLIFCPGDFSNINLSNFFTEEERKYPIHFKYGMQQQLNLIINLPDNWQVESQDVDKSIKSDFGEASWHWYTNDNKLHIQNQFILVGDEINPVDYPKFKSFLKEVKLQELEQVLLTNQ